MDPGRRAIFGVAESAGASKALQLAGDVDTLLHSHRLLTGPRRSASSLPANQVVVEESHTDKQSTFLVRTGDPVLEHRLHRG